jgi:ATP-dependent Clp protease protease subunit
VVVKMGSKKFWNFKALDDKTGELTLYEEIANETWWGDEVTPKEFKTDLDGLGDIDTLNIYINSPGGDVFAGQAIHSMLKRHQAHKNVYIDGVAASIASVIAMAGDTIFMPKNAMMMIHNPWTFGIGNAEEFRKLAEDLDKIRESLIAAYEGRSALTRDEIIELMNEETWLTTDECLDYGFCDVVEKEKQMAACIDKAILARYKNTPEEFLTEEPKPKPNEQLKQLQWTGL